MLAKALTYSRAQLQSHNSGLLGFASRGVYKAGQEPKVFVNKNTRVICQGITGKHVSRNGYFIKGLITMSREGNASGLGINLFSFLTFC